MLRYMYLFWVFILYNNLQAQISDFKSIDFTRADNIAKLHHGARLDNLPLLAYKLTNRLPTEVEKFRAIYVWVCHNIKGDHSMTRKISNQRKKLKNNSNAWVQWNNDYKNTVFKKLRKHKKTMCTGYAYLVKELCYLANIECNIVDGYGRTVDANIHELEIANHSWNVVKLDEKWYLCDATWSSGYTVEGNVFVQDYNDGYFLTDPILFGKNHFPLDQKWLLDNNMTSKKFVSEPLVYGETFEQEILPIYPTKMNLSIPKNDEIKFRFKTTKNLLDKNISLVYYSGNSEKKLKIYNIQKENNVISFSYKSKHRGIYDTHLKVNGDIVMTYTLRIKKAM